MAAKPENVAVGEQGDWLAGWDANPVVRAGSYAGWSEQTGSQALKDSSGKTPHKGFRASFLDYRAKTVAHVPGPGSYRTVRAFPLYDEGDKQHKGMMNSGRLADSGFMSMSQTALGKKLKSSVHGQAHLKEGLDVDMRHTVSASSHVPFISKTTSMRNLKSYKDANPILMPSSFQTPGPGSYIAHSCFGAASGGSRKRYLGTNKHDNAGKRRDPEKFAASAIEQSTASSTSVPRTKFRMTKSQGTVGLGV
eukprot:TRINITY_DN24155_c0_g1_i2.p1 TRINITY_DN24155_c0_g1~~TRINITY_DN24155_c0_g1_i2.p1  ORF type:complete len:250 (+),score=37.96 TRINITY_DN24155_c0_g1_i2:72-821(+)